jgi:hypothetical protein
MPTPMIIAGTLCGLFVQTGEINDWNTVLMAQYHDTAMVFLMDEEGAPAKPDRFKYVNFPTTRADYLEKNPECVAAFTD